LLLAGSPAIAAQAAPTTFNLCLTNSTHLCLVSNGVGNQVTISSNSTKWSVWHVARSGTGPNGEVKESFENASGNCLRAGAPSSPGSQGVVKLKSGACGATDGADFWDDLPNSGKTQSDFYPPDLLLVHAATSGSAVWHATSRPGDWFNWSSFTVHQS
jgi:hypothetical protein